MYPNSNQPTNPADYLNQIAPHTTNKVSLFSNKPILIAGIVAIVLLVIVIVMGIVSAGVPRNDIRLAARLTSTAEVVAGANSKMKSSQLRAINTTLNSQLINIIRDIEPILTKENIKIAKLDASIVASESNTNLLARLEDARLNVKYDRIYASEMSTQIDNIMILMRQIYKSSNSTSMKTFLETSVSNLAPIQKQLADFRDATI